jgi:hypothetical protein
MAPSMFSVQRGAFVQLMAYALDQFHNPMAQQPTLVWSKVSGPGTVTSNGFFQSFAPGTSILMVQATVNGVTVSATVTVNVF